MLSLTSLAPASTAIVRAIQLPVEKRRRLMEMGLIEGARIQLVRFAPLRDPVQVKVRGYHLTLRRREADHIWVETHD